jgi:hypothetical protein
MLLDSTKLARALGLGASTLYALKRCAKDRGNSPFVMGDRYSTPARILAWLDANKDFVARNVYRKAAP